MLHHLSHWAHLMAVVSYSVLLCRGQDSSCTVAYPNLTTAGNNGVIGPSTQVVFPQAAFTGCGRITEWDMLAVCSGGSPPCSVFLQVWTRTPDREVLKYQLKSSELVTVTRTSDVRVDLSSPTTFSGLQNLTFQHGDVPGMYVHQPINPLLQPGVVNLDNDHQSALSDDIDHYLRVRKDSVVEEVTFNRESDNVTGQVPLISIQVSGCSCTGGGNPADGNGNGNTGNGNVNNGDGGTVIGGAIAAGVIVVLLVVAMVTGAVIVGILVWRRKQTSVLYVEPIASSDDNYWMPSFKEEEIYQQMAVHSYQEFGGECIELLTKLGEGEFGEVYKAVLKSPTGTSQDVAVKLVKKGAPPEEKVKLLQEAAILGQFSHKHIVRLVGVVTVDEPRVMITQLLSGGNLKGYLDGIAMNARMSKTTDPALPFTLLKFCRQVAEGLSYLAGKSFVHRDIAARNILLDEEHNCKLSGFGMTQNLSEEDYYTKVDRRLHIKWTAPEVVFYKKYSTSSDVWSYGMLMYEIWSLGHRPFGESQPRQVAKLLEERYCQPPPPGCPRAVYAIMVDCWHPEPHYRPAASSLCSSLNQSEQHLLFWDQSTPAPSPSAHILGAPLEVGRKLYGELQRIYQDYI